MGKSGSCSDGWDIFFAAEDGEALYSQQKQDQELTVALIFIFLSINVEHMMYQIYGYFFHLLLTAPT